MSKIHAIIVDDERPARKELTFLLNAIPEVSILGEADTIKSAITLIQQHKPDILFLDIQLAGENGFDLLKQIEVDFNVIFVTAYDEYAIKAFDANATDYLLKPVDPLRLEISIQRVLGNIKAPKPTLKKFDYGDSIYVKLNNSTARFIEVKSIVAISAVGNYTRLQITDGQSHLVLKTLKRWEEELSETSFIRIHRATLVNLKYIHKINSYSKSLYQVYMQHIDEPFEVSRNCYKNLKKANF